MSIFVIPWYILCHLRLDHPSLRGTGDAPWAFATLGSRPLPSTAPPQDTPRQRNPRLLPTGISHLGPKLHSPSPRCYFVEAWHPASYCSCSSAPRPSILCLAHQSSDSPFYALTWLQGFDHNGLGRYWFIHASVPPGCFSSMLCLEGVLSVVLRPWSCFFFDTIGPLLSPVTLSRPQQYPD